MQFFFARETISPTVAFAQQHVNFAWEQHTNTAPERGSAKVDREMHAPALPSSSQAHAHLNSEKHVQLRRKPICSHS